MCLVWRQYNSLDLERKQNFKQIFENLSRNSWWESFSFWQRKIINSLADLRTTSVTYISPWPEPLFPLRWCDFSSRSRDALNPSLWNLQHRRSGFCGSPSHQLSTSCPEPCKKSHHSPSERLRQHISHDKLAEEHPDETASSASPSASTLQRARVSDGEVFGNCCDAADSFFFFFLFIVRSGIRYRILVKTRLSIIFNYLALQKYLGFTPHLSKIVKKTNKKQEVLLSFGYFCQSYPTLGGGRQHRRISHKDEDAADSSLSLNLFGEAGGFWRLEKNKLSRWK